jgi:diguanylate cyclase (GGDEF)-like protein
VKEILVKTLMSEDVTCLPPDAHLQLAVKKMVEQRYSCIIIIKNEIPFGIVTERDLVKILNHGAGEISLSLPVSDFMSSPIISLNENETLFDAMVISRAERIRQMPVVNNEDYLVGLVTYSDLVDAHFHAIEIQSDLIEQSFEVKIEKLQQLNDELLALSMEDHLMEIGNRRAMEVDLGHTHYTSTRYGHPYSLLLIDIDFFKQYNDNYGHGAGDNALKAVAKSLKANIRGSDRLYRYGGEEILAVLPHTNASQADEVGRKLVSSIAKSSISHKKSPYEILTISCGGACVLNNEQLVSSWVELIEQVDHNLYQAKNDGRNCSVVSLEQ